MIRILTVATKPDGYLDGLKWCLDNRTCACSCCCQVEVCVLGENTQWVNYFTKLKLIREKLEQCDDERDIIIMCDAYDVLFDRHKSIHRLVQTFRQSQADLLFSTIDLADRPSVLRTIAKRILTCLDISPPGTMLTCNGGLYMGYCYALKRIFDEMYFISGDKIDDERLINQVLNKHTVANSCHVSQNFTKFQTKFKTRWSYSYFMPPHTFLVALDTNSKLFYNHVYTNLFDSKYTPRASIMRESEAYFFHFVGNQNLHPICAYEQIPIDENTTQTYSRLDKLAHYTKFFYNEFIFLFILFILFLMFLIK